MTEIQEELQLTIEHKNKILLIQRKITNYHLAICQWRAGIDGLENKLEKANEEMTALTNSICADLSVAPDSAIFDLNELKVSLKSK